MLDKSHLSGELAPNSTISPEEISRFDALAESWWNPNGKYKTALIFNQARLSFIVPQISNHFARDTQSPQPFANLSILDVGCGGGLISEPLAKKGADVTGIDASALSIQVAKRHAQQQNIQINYQHCLSSQLVAQKQQYDVVINAEVVEHVPDQSQLIKESCFLVKPGGLLILATLNRTLKSWAIAIVGAEYVMRYLPIGTHSWSMFVKPSEMQTMVENEYFSLFSETGMMFNPFSQRWRLSNDLSVNYIQCFSR